MSYVIVDHCPKCGAPIWVPSNWWSILPPPPMYTCACAPRLKIITTTSTYVVSEELARRGEEGK